MCKRILSLLLLCGLLFTACAADPERGSSAPSTPESGVASDSPSAESGEADPPVLDGAQLVVFGDSLTALGTWGKSLAERLNMYYFNGAMGGITSEVGLDRFAAFVANRGPDFVTLCFGMNDLIMTAPNTPRVTIESFKKNLLQLVNRTREAGAIPILVTTNPLVNEVFFQVQGQDPAWYTGVSTPLAWLDTYNQATREVAAEAGCLLADVRKACDAYPPRDVTKEDGIHLNELGNQIFCDTIAACLEGAFRRDPSVPPVVQTRYTQAENGTSLISFVPDDWYCPDRGALSVRKQGDALGLFNTNGLWPDGQYVPSQPITADPTTAYLHVNMSTANVNTSVVLYFGSSTPSAYTDGTFATINPYCGVNTDSYTGDITANQSWDVCIPLNRFSPGPDCYTDDGQLILSGIKLYVAGTAYQTVTVNAFEIVYDADGIN